MVVMLGDLRHGRTVHSLAKLLVRSGLNLPIDLRYVSPQGLGMPSYVTEYVSEYGKGDGNGNGERVTQRSFDSLPDAMTGANVLYVTRIQRERFASEELYESAKGSYVVNDELLRKYANPPGDMIVLHPLPRVDEISTDIDADPRAYYFTQMENGMYVRMAILALLLSSSE